MISFDILLLGVPILIMAVLYSSVGHGGASGYIAIMALMGMSVAEIRPMALIMNIAVAALVVIRFSKYGYFSFRLFWPFAVVSVPMAYIGGATNTPAIIIKIAMGVTLLIAATYMFMNKHDIAKPEEAKSVHCIIIGIILGYLAGLTGVGGAIYLSPIIYFMRWADMHRNAAISGAFVLVNSIAGLIGYFTHNFQFPSQSIIYIFIAITGGLIGTYIGVNKFESAMMKKILALVLAIAGSKLIIGTVA
jgi:uncharacterized protein